MTNDEFRSKVCTLAEHCSEPALRQWLQLLLEELLPHASPAARPHIEHVIALLPCGTQAQLRAAADAAYADAAYADAAYAAYAAAYAAYAADAAADAAAHAAARAAAAHAAHAAAAAAAAAPINKEHLITQLMLLAG